MDVQPEVDRTPFWIVYHQHLTGCSAALKWLNSEKEGHDPCAQEMQLAESLFPWLLAE